MRVPSAWLREYCDPDLAVEELAERLAMRTTEVERVLAVDDPKRLAAGDGARRVGPDTELKRVARGHDGRPGR